MDYQQLTDRVGVVGGGVNVGVLRTADHGAVLIDTGANEGNARKILRFVRDEMHLVVRAILTTHAHADHFGGNAFVVKRTNATVYASPIEAEILRFPWLQPSLLFGGAAAPAALRERFILAQASRVDEVIRDECLQIEDVQIQVAPLAGHSPNQVGFLVDRVFFCADVVFPAEAIDKYRIPYLFDLDRHLVSIDAAMELDFDHVVPGHGPVETSLQSLRDRNLAIIDETTEEILGSLRDPLSLDDVARSVFTSMSVPMHGHVSYYLLRPTIAAYLSSLEARGEVEHVLVGKQSLWRRP